MVSSLILLPDVFLFLGAAAACFALGLWRAKGDDPNFDAATSSTGTEMRRRLQLLLLLANLARAVALAVEMALFEDGACPGAWTCALVRAGPDLFFLTTYSMLILFWAQLSHTATGSSSPLLRPAFLLSNGLLYLGFLLIVVCAASKAMAPGQFVQALFHLLGIFYLLATAFLLKYGLRMLRFSQLALPPVLRRRLLLLCAACSAAFLLHAAYYLATAAQVAIAGASAPPLLHGGYPPAALLPAGSAFLFDALFYPVMELLPSVAILFALHHKRRAYLLDNPAAAGAYSKISSGGGGGLAGNGASHVGVAANGGGGGPLVGGYGATGAHGMGGGGMGNGVGMARGGGGGGGQYYQGGHVHPSLFGGGGNVVVREGNGGLMMGMLGGLLDPTATPSTSSGSTRSEV